MHDEVGSALFARRELTCHFPLTPGAAGRGRWTWLHTCMYWGPHVLTNSFFFVDYIRGWGVGRSW